MISHEHRCIFIHIPKTGGMSIEDVIWPGERTEQHLWAGLITRYRNKYQTGGLQHLLARQIRQEVGSAVFDSYFKFTFVRNPWDKAVSQFAYMAQRPDLREMIGIQDDTPFSEYLELTGLHTHIQWQRQLEFLRDEDGANLVDFVGRFENLRQDAQFVFERIGLNRKELPHINATSHRPYREYYDLQTRERLRQRYEEDIEAFGYQF